MFCLEFAQAVYEVSAIYSRFLDQSFFAHDVDRCGNRSCRERVRLMTGEMNPALSCNAVGDLIGCDDTGDRETRPGTFRDNENVRFDVVMFASEPLSGAAKAGLGLVHNQQCVQFGRDLLQSFQISRRRNYHPAGGKDGLDDNSSDIAMSWKSSFDRSFKTLEVALGIPAFHRAVKTVRRHKTESFRHCRTGSVPITGRKDRAQTLGAER